MRATLAVPKTFTKMLAFIMVSFATILGTMISIFMPEVALLILTIAALSCVFAGSLAVGGLSDAATFGIFAISFSASVAGAVGGLSFAFSTGIVTVGVILIANAAIDFLHARKGE